MENALTAADYRPFVERMIEKYEGGYGWNKNDPGGPTKYGVTCYDLAEHRHQKMDSMMRWAPLVRAMTLGEADAIYAEKYATACAFDELQAGCDCVVFDFAVNSGPSRAVRYAQTVVNVAIDGKLGPKTLAAINVANPETFINDLCDMRLHFLQRLSTWSVFGKGWSSRVADLRKYSLGLLAPASDKLMAYYQNKPRRIHLAFAKAWELTLA